MSHLSQLIQTIPTLDQYPLEHVFDNLTLKHKPNTLWLEFGVASGKSINYISTFTNGTVFGFDSFEGLPEKWTDEWDKGAFNMNGETPDVNDNVVLIKGWYNETLPYFMKGWGGNLEMVPHKKISFIHMDSDLYSSTKYIFDQVKDALDTDCIIVFDELVNYEGFDGETGELKAFYEFITENKVDYEWIGMKGRPFNDPNYQAVALVIHSVQPRVEEEKMVCHDQEGTSVCLAAAGAAVTAGAADGGGGDGGSSNDSGEMNEHVEITDE